MTRYAEPVQEMRPNIAITLTKYHFSVTNLVGQLSSNRGLNKIATWSELSEGGLCMCVCRVGFMASVTWWLRSPSWMNAKW